MMTVPRPRPLPGPTRRRERRTVRPTAIPTPEAAR